jgi:hypothetical protein
LIDWSVPDPQVAAERAGTAPWPPRSMGDSSPPAGRGSTAGGSAAAAASRYCLQLFPSPITLRFSCFFFCPLLSCLIRLARSHFLDCTHKNLQYYLGLRCAVASSVLNNLRELLCSCSIHACFWDGLGFPVMLLSSEFRASTQSSICRLRGNLFCYLFFFFSSVSWLSSIIKKTNLGPPVRFRSKCSSDNSSLKKMLPKSGSSIFLQLIVCSLLWLFACIFLVSQNSEE